MVREPCRRALFQAFCLVQVECSRQVGLVTGIISGIVPAPASCSRESEASQLNDLVVQGHTSEAGLQLGRWCPNSQPKSPSPA